MAADERLVSIGQLFDELVGVGQFRGLDDLRQVVLRVATADIICDGIGEGEVILHYERHLSPKRLVSHPTDVLILNADLTGGRVEEAGNQVNERPLLDSVRTNNRYLRTGGNSGSHSLPWGLFLY